MPHNGNRQPHARKESEASLRGQANPVVERGPLSLEGPAPSQAQPSKVDSHWGTEPAPVRESLVDRISKLLHVDPYHNLLKDSTADRIRKALSPRYIISKLALTVYERSHPNYPWIVRDAIKQIEGHLTNQHVGFEWGSGNGTLWFAQRSKRLVSVEHHTSWYRVVEARLRRARVSNVDYRLVEETNYLSVIDEYAPATFDYILVDGLMRDAAFLRSISKLKPGGWIIFDNVNWYLPSNSPTPHSRHYGDPPVSPLWAEVDKQVATWRTLWSTNGVNDTAIFIKPQ